jgi:hypothetical protein
MSGQRASASSSRLTVRWCSVARYAKTSSARRPWRPGGPGARSSRSMLNRPRTAILAVVTARSISPSVTRCQVAESACAAVIALDTRTGCVARVEPPRCTKPVAREEGTDEKNRPYLIVTLAFALLGFGVAVPAAMAQNTALDAEIPGTPKHTHGSDGREHIDYDVVLTNAFTADVTLTSVTVRGGGRTLLRMTGAKLADSTNPPPIGSNPTPTIPASSTVVTQVDVALPRSAGRRVPRRLTTRVSYALAPNTPLGAAIGAPPFGLPRASTGAGRSRSPLLCAAPAGLARTDAAPTRPRRTGA